MPYHVGVLIVRPLLVFGGVAADKESNIRCVSFPFLLSSLVHFFNLSTWGMTIWSP